MSKTPLELLKEIEWKQPTRPNGTCPYCAHTAEHGHSDTCNFGKALSLLESEPEPGEFTKRARYVIEQPIAIEVVADLITEACDLIDRLTAENKSQPEPKQISQDLREILGRIGMHHEHKDYNIWVEDLCNGTYLACDLIDAQAEKTKNLEAELATITKCLRVTQQNLENEDILNKSQQAEIERLKTALKKTYDGGGFPKSDFYHSIW